MRAAVAFDDAPIRNPYVTHIQLTDDAYTNICECCRARKIFASGRADLRMEENSPAAKQLVRNQCAESRVTRQGQAPWTNSRFFYPALTVDCAEEVNDSETLQAGSKIRTPTRKAAHLSATKHGADAPRQNDASNTVSKSIHAAVSDGSGHGLFR